MFVCVLMYDYISTLIVIECCVLMCVLMYWLYFYINSYRMFIDSYRMFMCVLMYDYISTCSCVFWCDYISTLIVMWYMIYDSYTCVLMMLYFFINSYIMFVCVLMYDNKS